jgi:hypothetical protein
MNKIKKILLVVIFLIIGVYTYNYLNSRDFFSFTLPFKQEKDIDLAENIVNSFLNARLAKDQDSAFLYLTESAEQQYLLRSDLPFTGLSNPYFSSFQILEKDELENGNFKFKIRIYETYLNGREAGYFNESLFLEERKGEYLIKSFERDEYVNFRESAIKSLFAEKYKKDVSDITVVITQGSEDHLRGLVTIEPGGNENSGMFLVARSNEEWVLIFDGQGSYSCEMVQEYDFPEDMVGDCYINQ